MKGAFLYCIVAGMAERTISTYTSPNLWNDWDAHWLPVAKSHSWQRCAKTGVVFVNGVSQPRSGCARSATIPEAGIIVQDAREESHLANQWRIDVHRDIAEHMIDGSCNVVTNARLACVLCFPRVTKIHKDAGVLQSIVRHG